MELTNLEMERMMAQLEPYLGRTDKIGYAAARNTRILRGEAMEYIERKRELMLEFGEVKTDEDGNPTGMVGIDFGTPAFEKFSEAIAEWASISHEPDIYTLPAEEAVGKISGTEMLNLEWLFEWE